MEFEESVVRIGGRSKSEILKDRNIRKIMYESGKTGKQHHRTRQDINYQLDTIQGNGYTTVKTHSARSADTRLHQCIEQARAHFSANQYCC
jgi:hypothetical protein